MPPVGDWCSPSSGRWGRVDRRFQSTWPDCRPVGHAPSGRLVQPILQAVGQGGQMISVHMARLDISWPCPQRETGVAHPPGGGAGWTDDFSSHGQTGDQLAMSPVGDWCSPSLQAVGQGGQLYEQLYPVMRLDEPHTHVRRSGVRDNQAGAALSRCEAGRATLSCPAQRWPSERCSSHCRAGSRTAAPPSCGAVRAAFRWRWPEQSNGLLLIAGRAAEQQLYQAVEL